MRNFNILLINKFCKTFDRPIILLIHYVAKIAYKFPNKGADNVVCLVGHCDGLYCTFVQWNFMSRYAMLWIHGTRMSIDAIIVK